MNRHNKQKFKLVAAYMLATDDLTRAAAFSDGVDQGYKLSLQRIKELSHALKGLLGYTNEHPKAVKVNAIKLVNYKEVEHDH